MDNKKSLSIIHFLEENKDIVIASGIILGGWVVFSNLRRRPIAPFPFLPLPYRPKIVIDPGHGGIGSKSTGTYYEGSSGRVYEADINWAVSSKLVEYLKSLNAEVILTRKQEDDPSIGDRRALNCKVNPDAFVSIHTDSVSHSDCPGVQDRTVCYFAYESSKPLAEAIKNEVAKIKHRDSAGNVTSTRIAAITKVEPSKWGVLNQTCAPSVLIELGFICSQTFRDQLYKNPYFIPEMAKAIGDGIYKYLKTRI